MYVLTGEKRDYTKVFAEKDNEIEQLKSICQRSQVFTEELQNEIKQLTEQLDTLKFINDDLQTAKDSVDFRHEKLRTEFETIKQLQIDENKIQKEESLTIKSRLDESLSELSQVQEKFVNSQKELESCRAIISDLNIDLNNQSEKLENNKKEIVALQDKISKLEAKIQSSMIDDAKELKRSYENLKYELAETECNNQRIIAELNHEIDELKENAKAYCKKESELKEINEILSQQYTEMKEQTNQMVKFDEYRAENAVTTDNNSNEESSYSEVERESSIVERLRSEKVDLEKKMNKILSEVQDVSNRNLFLEQQCENYLILEQHNERLKLQNNKLSRQLDETLVSIKF